jgi:hypothetical protein
MRPTAAAIVSILREEGVNLYLLFSLNSLAICVVSDHIISHIQLDE